jgi:hypothetical protein
MGRGWSARRLDHLASSKVLKTIAFVTMCPYPGYSISTIQRTKIIESLAMVSSKWNLEVDVEGDHDTGFAVGDIWWYIVAIINVYFLVDHGGERVRAA